MSLLPARMSRLLVGGHQQHLEAVIDTLHAQGVMHIEDYQDPTGTTRIGTPLEAGEKASEALVDVRGLQKSLGTESAAPGAAEPDPRAVLTQARAATAAAVESAQALRASHAALEAEAAVLVPLAGLDVDLGAVGALRSVKAYVGTCRTDPTPRLQALQVPNEFQVAPAPGGHAVLLVVVPAGAAAAERALADAGYQAAALPRDRHGTPAVRLAEIEAEKRKAADAIAASETRLGALRAEWGPRLAAAERALAAEVERTQAPLRFGVTGSTFHVEGWVPRSQRAAVEQELRFRFGESLYLHDLGDAPRSVDAHAHAAHGAQATHGEPHRHPAHGGAAAAVPAGNKADQAGHDDGHHAPTAADDPPIHLENKGPAKPYEFLLGLLAKPRYREVDPTTLMLVFFPLFFGLMVGDLAIGLLIMGVGLFLKKNRVFGIGGPAVGRALFMGGLLSAAVGLVVFGEAFGIHFVVSDEAAAEGELSWENILGVHFPSEGLIHKTGGHGTTHGDAAIVTHAEGAEATGLAGILAPHGDTHLSVAGLFNLGYYSKVHDTLALLVWAMLIGLVHVILGLVIGIRNVYVQHGAKLALQEKGAWLLLMAGFALAILAWGTFWGYLGAAVVAASVALLWMGAAHTIGVGFIALLEVPGLAGNILSYTRLAAIGASKAGMAIAFASIAFETIGGGNVHSVLGWIVYLAGQGLILVLAIIAGTLQSLRLQFVEFFGKFYTGGGRPYLPFGRRAA